MQLAVNELKIRAKLLLKALRSGHRPDWLSGSQSLRDEWQLKDCQTLLAQKSGFRDWHHARLILSGEATRDVSPDFGELWYARACGVLINQWFADYAPARQALLAEGGSCLFPYKRQFVVAAPLYTELLGLSEQTLAWHSLNHDLIDGYGTPAWDLLALACLCHKLDSLK